MNRGMQTLSNCPSSCWQHCEYGADCLIKARNSQTKDDWVNRHIGRLAPYLKSMFLALPDYEAVSIKFDYEDRLLVEISFNGTKEYIQKCTEGIPEDES